MKVAYVGLKFAQRWIKYIVILTNVATSVYSSTLKMEAIFSSEIFVDFNRLHGILSSDNKAI
jgi:hypothetical protein